VSSESDKPSDVYYMITVNCRYKQRIHNLLKELRNINQRRRELDDKYAKLKRDLAALKQVKQYKPVKGDAIDELFAIHLNKANLNLPVKRLGEGKYLFGTKKILAKIINGKLVIRVGGGYMSADEFIEQYGQIEMLKMMKAQGDIEGVEMFSKKSNDKNSDSMNDMKQSMRKSMLSNTKIYGSIDTSHDHDQGRRNTMMPGKLNMSNDGSDGGKGSPSLKKSFSLQTPSPMKSSKLGS
jgi:hypothetical protein